MEDKILCNVSDLEPIADAVREKENTNKLYSVEELKVKVPDLISSSGGTDIGDSLDRLNTINGGTAATTLEDAVDNTEAHANNQEALISQITEALEGKATGGSPTLQEKAVMPTNEDQLIVADEGYQGLSRVTVSGDANLVAKNIAQGISVFGVTGTHSGGTAIETANITINWEFNEELYCVYYTKFTADSFVPTMEIVPNEGPTTITLSNVAVGSIFILFFDTLTNGTIFADRDSEHIDFIDQLDYASGMDVNVLLYSPLLSGDTEMRIYEDHSGYE